MLLKNMTKTPTGFPKVSVIIPTYNRANFVTKAIDSVLAQAFNDYEIIVIDDGSTDNTREVLKPYRDKIQYIHQKNSGVSAARNAGIKIAKGEWIAFLDSDDEWMPEYLSWQMEQARQNPRICTHITNSIQVSIDGKEINTFQENPYKLFQKFNRSSCLTIERPLCFVIKYLRITTMPATIMRRDALLKAGLFNTMLTISEDIDMIARMALQGPLGICDKVLVHIYRRNESTINLAEQWINEGFYAYESHFKIYENIRNQKNLKVNEKLLLNKMMGSSKRALANLLLRDGKRIEARDYWKEAFFIYPSIKSAVRYLMSFLPSKLALRFIRKGRHIKFGKSV